LEDRGAETEAMISWVDLTPTILDFAGGLDGEGELKADVRNRLQAAAQKRSGQQDRRAAPGVFHGRSFLSVLRGEQVDDQWDEVFASHTFHEIQVYYPMRVVRERRYKLIWNIAHPLPFPFASDLWAAPTWQRQYEQGLDASYGVRAVGDYIQRREFELYDLQQDPAESLNLAADPAHQESLQRLKKRLRDFQQRTSDPWISKWDYQ
jgi:N-sulfoglucosamine sulfohydrolase